MSIEKDKLLLDSVEGYGGMEWVFTIYNAW